SVGSLSGVEKTAAHGVEKEIHVRNLDKCPDCNGTGSRSKKAATTCNTCGGRGEVRQTRQSILGTISTVTPCPHCHGEGQTISDPCPTCSGAGRSARSRNIKVKIPAGIDSGSRLRVSGEGNMGQRGGEQGDLYVYIEIKHHPVYEREGDNLSSKQAVLFTQAALGDEIDVETIFGKVSLKIPTGTQPGTVFRLKGKGMPHLHSHGHGDLFVSVVIETPKHLSADEKTVLEYFSKIRKENTAFSKSADVSTRMKKMLGK
ncbi:MAG: DnaJ C-terminal domain-containing protein, partial [Candidatus Margulisiibacteriota bacterium]